MAWMTKDLALDLLAILIGATENAFNTIKDAPDGDWPPAVAQQPADAPEKQASADAPEEPKPDTPPAAAPHQQETPAPNANEQLVEAKNLLQGIVAAGGREWVTGTLLPQFGVAKLSDVPADKLPELIETAKQKKQKKQEEGQ
ncbi:hypothetical protein HMPREF3120_05435 [Corynebacterium sp. HMSC11D10]|uniref:hypothetical protein n=1 Tax=Corynebacterium sp. HMSC11D10 TaxID=1581088 RepID=UPI0008A1700A|nr:hypothetical protein [Corynebacterium sp. HMSC11D10]OFU54863.1 hypothetical protein HMPREF3120_05435 [Corynebacterium sp. HMSC11D10]